MEGQETRPLFVGNLSETPFSKLLHEIGSMGITGTLTLERGKVKKSIVFDHGKPARVTSNLLQEVLGRYLVSIGKLNQEQYTESIDAAFRSHRLHGDILVERGLLTDGELRTYLRDHSVEKILNLFKWTEGEYRFSKNDLISPGGDFPRISVESLIFTGVRRFYSLERITAAIKPYGGSYLRAGSKMKELGTIDGLSEDERWLIDLADGTKTVSETIEMSPLEFIDSSRVIYGALITDVLSVRAERGQSPAEEPVRDAGTDAAAQILATYHEMSTKNYFEILGVDEDAPAQDIKRAYVRLVKEYHPDSLGPETSPVIVKTANQVFDLVTRAYKVLTDQTERADYIRSFTEPGGGMDAEKTSNIMNAELQFQKGKVFLKKRDYRSALESFGWAVKLVPDEGEYLAYLGWTLFLAADDKQGSDAVAGVRHLKQAAMLNPSLEAAQLFLGAVYKEQKLRDIATLHFRKALEINPESQEARRELSLLGTRGS